jgi:hypothetical protein
MIKYNNPFRMRASERIESDSTFLRLYSPFLFKTLIEKQDQKNCGTMYYLFVVLQEEEKPRC